MAYHGKLPRGGPLILAIENSGLCGSVALVTGDGCLAEHSLLAQQSHSRRLLPSIDTLFSETSTSITDVDAIAVSLGPGSFTGLRIGLATAKALCMGAGKPLIGIPTLKALAVQLAFQPQQICAVLDARKGEVFASCYKNTDRGLINTLAASNPSPARLIASITEATVFVGDGVRLLDLASAKGPGAHFSVAPPSLFFPKASAVGHLGLGNYAAGRFIDVLTAAPLYLRASDAEIQQAAEPAACTD